MTAVVGFQIFVQEIDSFSLFRISIIVHVGRNAQDEINIARVNLLRYEAPIHPNLPRNTSILELLYDKLEPSHNCIAGPGR